MFFSEQYLNLPVQFCKDNATSLIIELKFQGLLDFKLWDWFVSRDDYMVSHLHTPSFPPSVTAIFTILFWEDGFSPSISTYSSEFFPLLRENPVVLSCLSMRPVNLGKVLLVEDIDHSCWHLGGSPGNLSSGGRGTVMIGFCISDVVTTPLPTAVMHIPTNATPRMSCGAETPFFHWK